VCDQVVVYPFASVDPTQGLHVQDVDGLVTCRAGGARVLSSAYQVKETKNFLPTNILYIV